MVLYPMDQAPEVLRFYRKYAEESPDDLTAHAALMTTPDGHDVVAIAPPGVSTHLRYFTLASSLRPGAYDVGWGLRDAATGQSVAFLAAPGTLRVMR